MWAIRVLSGQHAGQVFTLAEGRNLIGRAGTCNIRFNDLDVSKEHAIINLENSRLTVTDNQSRNGTYVNGILVQTATLKRGDKLSFNQTICDVVFLPRAQERRPTMIAPAPSYTPPPPHSMQFDPASMNQQGVNGASGTSKDSLLKHYFEEVFLPGIYHLAEVMEFKLVIGLFMLIFAVLVTALSTIPMIAITSDSIQIESRRRALTIARNLANINQQALLKEMESALSTQNADLEEGVTASYIIRQSDGSVIAPASKAGSIPAVPFIETARREQKEIIKQLDSSHIAVAVPMSAFNPETATYSVKAFAIVVYDMGALAVDDGRTLSLFFQTLLIALSLGFVLYYLFYRFVEYPVFNLNRQLDLILKNKHESSLQFNLNFPLMHEFVSNINTVLTRMGQPESDHHGATMNKDLEARNIAHLIGYAAVAISVDQNIVGLNPAAEEIIGRSESSLNNQTMALIPDPALQKSIYDLLERVSRDPGMVSKNELSFGGDRREISCQALTDKGKVTHYIITIVSIGG